LSRNYPVNRLRAPSPACRRPASPGSPQPCLVHAVVGPRYVVMW
jgi:hypothetical protein